MNPPDVSEPRDEAVEQVAPDILLAAFAYRVVTTRPIETLDRGSREELLRRVRSHALSGKVAELTRQRDEARAALQIARIAITDHKYWRGCVNCERAIAAIKVAVSSSDTDTATPTPNVAP